MEYRAKVDERALKVELKTVGEATHAVVDGQAWAVDLQWIPGLERYSLLLSGRSYEVIVEPLEEGQRLYVNGQPFAVSVQDERSATLEALVGKRASGDGAAHVYAPMPGMVIVLDIAPGQTVQAGQTLLVLEAMKMHNEVRAPRSGIITQLKIELGQRVSKGQEMVLIT